MSSASPVEPRGKQRRATSLNLRSPASRTRLGRVLFRARFVAGLGVTLEGQLLLLSPTCLKGAARIFGTLLGKRQGKSGGF